MQTFLKTTTFTAIASLMIGMSASALIIESPIKKELKLIQDMSFATQPTQEPIFNTNAKIGVARLDNGRLIPAPLSELLDWQFLDKRSVVNFEPISPAAVIKNIPEVPMGGRDSDNKLDEIRMTAADLKMDYVLVYGLGKDALWGCFGGKALLETGFQFDENTVSPRAGAKALLVDTYSGKIFGEVTSELIEFGVGDLTDKVDALIKVLISNEGQV
ncbi:MAG: hypothetical protein HKO02_07725 [Hyphomonadaceae bacterium]|nr:hypothetical protein [Hyphomonadaceae bacterium]